MLERRNVLHTLRVELLLPPPLVVLHILRLAVLFALPCGSGSPPQLVLGHTSLPCWSLSI